MLRCLLLSALAHLALSQNSTLGGWQPLSQNDSILIGLLFTVFFLTLVVSWVALFRFRKGYYVDGRMPPLIWGMQGGLAAWIFYCLGAIIADPPCWMTRFSIFFVFPIFGFFWVRAVRLVFQWEISTKLNAFHSLPQAAKTTEELYRGRGGFFVRNRRWITPKYLYSVITVYILFHFALCVEASFSLCPAVPLDANCGLSCWGRNLRLVWIFLVELTAFVIFFCYHLRKESDTMLVRFELATLFFYDMFSFFIVFFVYFSASYTATLLTVCFFLTVCACFIIWFPIVLDIRMVRRHEARPPKFTLATILQHPEGFKSVAAFLKLEFSAENVYFYQRVEEYRMASNRNEGAAEYLFDTFIAGHSPYQVNLSAPVATAIAQTLKRPGPRDGGSVSTFTKPTQETRSTRSASASLELSQMTTLPSNLSLAPEDMALLFDAAQAEVLHLMERDSWVRYLQSVQFERFTRDHMNKTNELVDTMEERMRSKKDHSTTASIDASAHSTESK